MKLLLLILGPLLRRTKRHPNTWGSWVTVLCFVVPTAVGLGMGIDVGHARQNSWHHHKATIVAVGRKPVSEGSGNVNGRIKLVDGRVIDHVVYWHARTEQKLDYWQSGQSTRFGNPFRWWVPRSFWYLLGGFIFGVGVFVLLCSLETVIYNYDKEEAKRRKARYATAFPELLRSHADFIVTRQDSIDAGNCSRGTDRFIDEHFPGRTEVTLQELTLFATIYNISWRDVCKAICFVMRREEWCDIELDDLVRPQ